MQKPFVLSVIKAFQVLKCFDMQLLGRLCSS